MKNWKLLRVLLVLGLVPLVSCREQTKEQTHVRSVRVLTVLQSGENTRKLIVPASINEMRETKLAFRVRGPLVRLNDTIGHFVSEGDVIAQIDARDFKIAVESAEAAYVMAKAELERYQKLLQKKSVAQSTYDRISANFTLSKTAYESACNALADTKLRAPFAGYLNHVFANNYEKVNAGQPIVSLIDLSQLEVNSWLSLSDISAITDSTQYACIVEVDGKEVRINGTLKAVGHKISASKQSYPISLVINAPKQLNLKAGMTTHLEIISHSSKHEPLVELPVTALYSKEGKSFVWLFDHQKSTVSAHEIKVDKFLSDDRITIKSGLMGGETVVSAGVNYLFEGQEVKRLETFSKTNIGKRF